MPTTHKKVIALHHEAEAFCRSAMSLARALFPDVQATWEERRWLRFLLDGPATVPSLAGRLGISRQRCGVCIQRLAGLGLVVKTENPRHSQSPCIELTPEGEALAWWSESVGRWITATLAAECSTRDLNTAYRTMAVLRNKLDDMRARGGDLVDEILEAISEKPARGLSVSV